MNSRVLSVVCVVFLVAGVQPAPTTMLADVKEAPTLMPSAPVLDASQFECDVAAWNNFKNEYKKGYQSSEDEERRRNIFCNNLREITKHNEAYDLGEETYQMGINQFSDMTQEEWANTFLMRTM